MWNTSFSEEAVYRRKKKHFRWKNANRRVNKVGTEYIGETVPKHCWFYGYVLGKTQQFDVVVRNKSYVQIIHAGSLHWVRCQHIDN